MNILIVDDEVSAIEAVQKNIDWEKLKITTIYTATSMKEAIQQLSSYEIDIMLCDIEMPMGSGLQLLQWINESMLSLECIYMTCHNDFSYAKKALQLGSLDYLLKPLSYEEVEETIIKAIAKINNETIIKKNSIAWVENKKIIFQKFWKDFFVGEISPDKESLLLYIRSKNIEIDLGKDYIPVLISIKKNNEDQTKKVKKLIDNSIKYMVEEQLNVDNMQKEIIDFSDNSILIMFKLEKKLNNLNVTECIKLSCQQLIQSVKQQFNLIVCSYIGTKDSIYNIPNVIEILQTIDFNNVIYTSVYSIQDYRHYILEYKNSNFNDWNELIQKNQFHKFADNIKSFLITEKNLNRIDRKFLEMFYQDFSYLITTFCMKHNIFSNQIFGNNEARGIFKNSIMSLDDLVRWIEYTINVMMNYVVSNENIINPIDKTKKYIEEHISEEILVEDIAKMVHLNADYLTRIFKKELGVSISRYVINSKIQKAKKLLSETDMLIGEVALAVGYFNYASFSKIFTKNEGVSPQEFKKNEKK